MDSMNLQNPLLLGGIGVAMFFVGRLLFQGDTSVEQRRRAATRLAGRLEPGEYHISVRAQNACGISAPSAVQVLRVP